MYLLYSKIIRFVFQKSDLLSYCHLDYIRERVLRYEIFFTLFRSSVQKIILIKINFD